MLGKPVMRANSCLHMFLLVQGLTVNKSRGYVRCCNRALVEVPYGFVPQTASYCQFLTARFQA